MKQTAEYDSRIQAGGRLLPLRKYPWWPTTWISSTGHSVPDEEIIEHGVFQNARHSITGLNLEVEYLGETYTGVISSPDLTQDDRITLRHPATAPSLLSEEVQWLV